MSRTENTNRCTNKSKWGPRLSEMPKIEQTPISEIRTLLEKCHKKKTQRLEPGLLSLPAGFYADSCFRCCCAMNRARSAAALSRRLRMEAIRVTEYPRKVLFVLWPVTAITSESAS